MWTEENRFSEEIKNSGGVSSLKRGDTALSSNLTDAGATQENFETGYDEDGPAPRTAVDNQSNRDDSDLDMIAFGSSTSFNKIAASKTPAKAS